MDRFKRTALIALCCLSIPMSIARAADAPHGVVAAIEKKYTVTGVSANHDQVTKDGTTMVMKTAGIYSLPTNDLVSTPPDNQVIDGKLKSFNIIQKSFLEKMGAHVLQTNDKVYITKIESKPDSKGDVLKFSLLTVDSLDVSGQDVKKKFSAVVSFRFKKGYLEESPPDEVESVVEAVMAPDTGSDTQAASADQAPQKPPAPAPPARAAAPLPCAAPPPAAKLPPPEISIGESWVKVLQAAGMPQEMMDLGKKQILIYKDLSLKITVVDNKVSDVQ